MANYFPLRWMCKRSFAVWQGALAHRGWSGLWCQFSVRPYHQPGAAHSCELIESGDMWSAVSSNNTVEVKAHKTRHQRCPVTQFWNELTPQTKTPLLISHYCGVSLSTYPLCQTCSNMCSLTRQQKYQLRFCESLGWSNPTTTQHNKPVPSTIYDDCPRHHSDMALD